MPWPGRGTSEPGTATGFKLLQADGNRGLVGSGPPAAGEAEPTPRGTRPSAAGGHPGPCPRLVSKKPSFLQLPPPRPCWRIGHPAPQNYGSLFLKIHPPPPPRSPAVKRAPQPPSTSAGRGPTQQKQGKRKRPAACREALGYRGAGGGEITGARHRRCRRSRESGGPCPVPPGRSPAPSRRCQRSPEPGRGSCSRPLPPAPAPPEPSRSTATAVPVTPRPRARCRSPAPSPPAAPGRLLTSVSGEGRAAASPRLLPAPQPPGPGRGLGSSPARRQAGKRERRF